MSCQRILLCIWRSHIFSNGKNGEAILWGYIYIFQREFDSMFIYCSMSLVRRYFAMGKQRYGFLYCPMTTGPGSRVSLARLDFRQLTKQLSFVSMNWRPLLAITYPSQVYLKQKEIISSYISTVLCRFIDSIRASESLPLPRLKYWRWWRRPESRGLLYMIQYDTASFHLAYMTQEWLVENFHVHTTLNIWTIRRVVERRTQRANVNEVLLIRTKGSHFR